MLLLHFVFTAPVSEWNGDTAGNESDNHRDAELYLLENSGLTAAELINKTMNQSKM